MDLKISISTKGKIFEGKAPEIIQGALEDVMYEATAFLEAEVKKRTPVGVFGAKGGLLSTIYGEVVDKGTPVMKGIVATSSLYGEVIEKGRRAGKTWPPGAAKFSYWGGKKHGQIGYEGGLIRWIEVKLGVDTETAAKLEFPIRRKIGKKGFKGVGMFKNALKESWPRLKKMFDDAGFKIAKRLNE